MDAGACATNELLADMSREDYRRVRPNLLRVELTLADVLVRQDMTSQHVFFPISGLIAVHVAMANRLSVGLVGKEGMIGAQLATGIRAPPALIMVQQTGAAMRMSASQFRRLADASVSLQRQMHGYTYRLLQSASRMVACNGFHDLGARLARCLLDASDKAHSQELHLTQSLLADMIGAQRSGVNAAATSLRRRKLIAYTRGRIRIVNRAALIRCACPCYDGKLPPSR
jgi:CRP-like cAMP-binding protein